MAKVLASNPPSSVTHWTGRAVAKAVGISLRAVQRIWDAHRLQPHRLRTFKKSKDPAFAEKVEDVVGLYMEPPCHAVVLSIDEKSQIQALDRTQPGLPLKPGKCATMTHDYKRNGTTTLFAALNILDGIPGIGRQSALGLLIEMPELGSLEPGQAASLAGEPQRAECFICPPWSPFGSTRISRPNTPSSRVRESQRNSP